MYKVYFAVYLSSQKCEKIENIRRIFVILFVYIEKKYYFCSAFVFNALNIWCGNVLIAKNTDIVNLFYL